MADKKQKIDAPFLLPAIGKPKKKPAKSSVREMGKRAAKKYMLNDKDSPLTTDLSRIEPQAYINNFITKEKYESYSPEAKRGADYSAEGQSRRTGMAKGGLAAKKKKK